MVLPFTICDGGIPVIDLKIDTINTEKFFFDSGSQIMIPLSNNTLYPCLKLQDSLFNSLSVENKAYLKIDNKYKGVDRVVLCDTLKVNDFRFENFILSNLDTYNKANYITVNFIFQFDQMYYNPFDKEIKFIRSKDKHTPIDDIGPLLHYTDSIRNFMKDNPSMEVFNSIIK